MVAVITLLEYIKRSGYLRPRSPPVTVIILGQQVDDQSAWAAVDVLSLQESGGYLGYIGKVPVRIRIDGNTINVVNSG